MRKSRLQIAPKTQRKKVEVIHLAVLDPGDGEQVYTIRESGGESVPLVALNPESVAVLTEYAQDAANKSGKVVNIIRFTRRTVHAIVRPLSTGD